MKEIINRIITGTFLGLISGYVFIYLPATLFSTILACVLIYILIFEWKNFFSTSTPMFWLLMPLYPILPFLCMIIMNESAIYRDLLFTLIVLISTHDTASYVFGKIFGRHKLAPDISPSKTWEGFLGGYVCASAGFAFFLHTKSISKPWWFIGLFTLLVCILGIVGDLFESYLKRRAAIKNSGAALPGHGGFLDRFDAIICTVFFFYIFKDQVIRLLN
jgi:phosphatidate cytidylyltransferase